MGYRRRRRFPTRYPYPSPAPAPRPVYEAPASKGPAIHGTTTGVNDNASVYSFNTWGDMLRHVELAVPKAGCNYAAREDADGWAGTRTWDEAMSLAREGWVEGERMVRDMAAKLEGAMLQGIVREEWNYDVEGTTFDIARYLEGEPECWVKVEEQAQAHATRHVKVVVNVGASGGVSAHVLTRRGAVAAALVSLLEYAGSRVELWAVFGSSYGYGTPADLCVRTCVKAYDQPLEPARVAFALANPAYLRRLCFKVMESDPDPRQTVHCCPAEAPHDASDLYIGEMLLGSGPWSTDDGAIAWLKDTLRAQGVSLRD